MQPRADRVGGVLGLALLGEGALEAVGGALLLLVPLAGVPLHLLDPRRREARREPDDGGGPARADILALPLLVLGGLERGLGVLERVRERGLDGAPTTAPRAWA